MSVHVDAAPVANRPDSFSRGEHSDHGLCNSCQKLVSAQTIERDGKVLLAKKCPDCGTTETLISGDVERYNSKRQIIQDMEFNSCNLGCTTCKIHEQPHILVLDMTNRCNMNCPICINNTPSMGFLFEPPIDYFEKIFDHYAQFDPPPSVQFFGGEPTMREDILDIVKLARSRGLSPRIVTNGLKLADEAFCRQLIENRVSILFAYDGNNPKLYKRLRNSENALALKLKALDNIAKIGRAKVVLMTLVAKGWNDQDMPELFQFAHDRRDNVRAIYFMPLSHTWDQEEFDLEAERITTEDIERLIDEAYPEYRVDFLPAGMIGYIPLLVEYLKLGTLPFGGAHPNCESLYLLVSNGERYLPIAHFLKSSTLEMAQAVGVVEQRLARTQAWFDQNALGKLVARLGLKRPIMKLRAIGGVVRLLRRHARLGRFFKGRGLGKLYHASAMLCGLALGRKSRTVLEQHTTAQNVLHLITLPFEDKSNLETHRLKKCPAAFGFIDPKDGEVKHVPVCAWGLHKAETMRRIMDYYNGNEPDAEPVEEEAAQAV